MHTILIVDDNESLLRMLQRTLSYEGFLVISAANGRVALSEVEKRRPDLIILDWLMPEIDGITVVRRLRALSDTTPILMLTARDAIEDRVEGLKSGADDYLIKPFAPEELLARVQALLRRTSTSSAQQRLVYADLSLDPTTRETQRGERKFDLTPPSLICCTSCYVTRAKYCRANAFWKRCGATTLPVKTMCWKFISAICVKKAKPMANPG